MDKREKITYCLSELIEKGNLDIIPEVFSENYIAHAGNKEHKGHAFLKRFSKILQKSIPKIKVIEVDFLLEDEKYISWKRTLTGTHKVNMMGIPASNKKIRWEEMVVSRFKNGLIAEEWLVSDLAGQLLLKQAPKSK